VLLVVAAVGSFDVQPATAQSNAACPTIANDAERLACYDRALRPTPPAAPAATAAPPTPRPMPVTPEPVTVPVVVAEVRQLEGRSATFTLENGEVWVQSDSRRVNLPDAPFDAEIKPGAMSSHFLVAKSGGSGIRVRRVQ